MLGIPDAADSDDGGEASGQFVTTQSCPRVHAGNDLDPLQPHPLQIMVVEPIVGDDLQSKLSQWASEYNMVRIQLYKRHSLVPKRYDKYLVEYKPDKDFPTNFMYSAHFTITLSMPKKRDHAKADFKKFLRTHKMVNLNIWRMLFEINFWWIILQIMKFEVL